MQGTISFDGTLSGGITGGGGGGSEVTITPVLTEGEKIADFEIDGTAGELYAPTPESLTASAPLLISSGVISIDLSAYDTASDIADTYLSKTDAASTYSTISYVNGIDLSLTNYIDNNYQPLLVAGANVSINPITHEISANGTWYSNTEQDTGDKWIDGRTIYIKTIELTGVNFNISQNNFKRANVELHSYIPDAEIGWIVDDASYIFEDISDTYYYRNFDFWEWEGDSTLTTQNVGLFKRDAAVDQIVVLTVKYVKGA